MTYAAIRHVPRVLNTPKMREEMKKGGKIKEGMGTPLPESKFLATGLQHS